MKAVITIHGVGDAIPGEALELIAGGIAEFKQDVSVVYEKTETVINGTVYPTIFSSEDSLPNIFEANWSDIKRPNRSWLGVLDHLFRLRSD